ncbi:MAG: hypothetical protein AB2563_03880 [Candidatus Thiodiazotropha endolucinida]
MNNVIALNTTSKSETDVNLDLPFISRDENGTYYWNPEHSADPVKNYQEDYSIGRHYGELLLDRLLNRKDKLSILGSILTSMHELEVWDGYEVGFLENVTRYTLAGHAVKTVLV